VSASIRIAAAQYPIDAVRDLEAWQKKLESWVNDAAKNGAKLLLFPEYASMELAAINPATAGDLHQSLRSVIELGEVVGCFHKALSEKHNVMIVGGSMPTRGRDDQVVNRATIYVPCRKSSYQDKIVMTRFEREQWDISGGNTLRVFRTPLGMFGISICYDVEYPAIARAQAEAGAQLILAPSCTDSMQGYWRVRIGAQARALENQCFVVQAPTVGMAPWSPAVDENYGAAAIFMPPDGDSPDDGVHAIGKEGESGWVYADLDLARIDLWRTQGAVRNFTHWPEQFVGQTAQQLAVELVDLC
jgi:predicted amidohydrolase